jgi:hypothetical protein
MKQRIRLELAMPLRFWRRFFPDAGPQRQKDAGRQRALAVKPPRRAAIEQGETRKCPPSIR